MHSLSINSLMMSEAVSFSTLSLKGGLKSILAVTLTDAASLLFAFNTAVAGVIEGVV